MDKAIKVLGWYTSVVAAFAILTAVGLALTSRITAAYAVLLAILNALTLAFAILVLFRMKRRE